jgi:hypothetical protein
VDAQHAVEGVIRLVGCAALFVVTLGQYRGPKDDGLLLEGAVGLVLITAGSYVTLASS